jgi:hypothetical protein
MTSNPPIALPIYLSKATPEAIVSAAYALSNCDPLYADEFREGPLPNPEEWVIGIERGLMLAYIRGRVIGLGLRQMGDGVLVFMNNRTWAHHTPAQEKEFIQQIEGEQVTFDLSGNIRSVHGLG